MQADGQMHVIVHPANTAGVGFCIFHKCRHHGKKVRAEIAVKKIPPVFRAENEMDLMEGKGLGVLVFYEGFFGSMPSINSWVRG